MSTSIFIKTWKNDLEWLQYCLKSIWKFGSGFEEIVLVADDSCRGLMDDFNLKVHYVRDWTNGYIQQQYVKLHADMYVSSDNILFVDSDVTFCRSFSESDFMKDGKPILLKTRYSSLIGSGAEVWKPLTEKAVGFSVEWEYMRRLPMLYLKDTVTAFRNAYHQVVDSMRNIQDRSFSEFNALGAFVEKYQPDLYFISDTEIWMPSTVIRQNWSWGGITPQMKSEIEEILR